MNWYEKRRTLLLGLYAGLISIGIVFSRSFSNLALEVCEAAAEAATFQARPPVVTQQATPIAQRPRSGSVASTCLPRVSRGK